MSMALFNQRGIRTISLRRFNSTYKAKLLPPAGTKLSFRAFSSTFKDEKSKQSPSTSGFPRTPQKSSVKPVAIRSGTTTHNAKGQSQNAAAVQTSQSGVDGEPGFTVIEAMMFHTRQEKPDVLRPALFAVSITVVSFTLAIYLTKAEINYLRQKTAKPNPTVEDLARTRLKLQVEKAKRWVDRMKNWGVPALIMEPYIWGAEKWITSSIPERVGMGMVAANLAVFLAWQIKAPALRSLLLKHFLHYPLAGRSYTLLTTSFSHESFWHIATNMYCTYTFLNLFGLYLGSRRSMDPDWSPSLSSPFSQAIPSPAYLMWAFFLSAGVMSGLGGQLYAAWRYSRYLQLGHVAKAASLMRPSLGFSGISLGIITIDALANPDGRVGIPLTPISLPITYGLGAISALDAGCLALGYMFWAHHVHLAGVACGAAYFYGAPHIWKLAHQLKTKA